MCTGAPTMAPRGLLRRTGGLTGTAGTPSSSSTTSRSDGATCAPTFWDRDSEVGLRGPPAELLGDLNSGFAREPAALTLGVTPRDVLKSSAEIMFCYWSAGYVRRGRQRRRWQHNKLWGAGPGAKRITGVREWERRRGRSKGGEAEVDAQVN